jgi:gamma-carbonic anhydrase
VKPGLSGRQLMPSSAKSDDEYAPRPRAVGRDAVFVRHRLKSPQVAESAYIAPTAVLCGDVTVGPHSRVLFGAVITAEGGPVQIGAHCVIMENAVVRGVPQHPTQLGDHVLIGPHASLTGCVIEGSTRIATGAVVFNGARVRVGAEVEFHAVVHVNTVVPAGVAVPMGWFAGGDPAELIPPGEWERIRELIGTLDYPGTVFGIGAGVNEGETPMPDIARRFARGLALHHKDTVLPVAQHDQLPDRTQPPRRPARTRRVNRVTASEELL